MEVALISPFIATILTILGNQALKEFGIRTGLNTKLEKLSRTFTTIQAVLCDAEVKQWNSGIEGEAVKTWLRQLKDAAYDAEDVLDELDLGVQRRQQQKGLKNHVRSFFSLHHNPIAFRVEMARKLKSAREKLDAIYQTRPPGLHVGAISSPQGVLEWRLTTSLVNDSEICGRDDEKAELINDLVSNSEALSVHALCGMGGLGKTTLAQLVFNDAETIEAHFDLRMWVCVSDDTDIKRLTRAIIESIEGDTGSNEQELDSLQRRLREKLAGKRFLLVLDDVWEDFPDKWDRLKNAIRSGAIGSVVLITTRIQRVAEKMATVPIRHMGRLSEDDSWSLFALHAFSKVKAEEFIKTIGKCIVKKCGGVPLVLKVLGSLMQLNQEKKEWLDIMKSELWDLGDEGKKILAILRLSYTHLPMNLKQCFSYCCIYPKNYVMKKDELIQIWMANGFISYGGHKDLHETGQEIFSELVARSFFQNMNANYLGNITCKMHDLLHDVATSVMEHEFHLIQPGGSFDGAKNYRHVSCSTLMKGNSKIPSLRSYFLMSKEGSSRIYGKDAVEWLSSQKHLRILRLDRLNFEQKLSMSLSKHLRYLDVSISSIKRLPESTSSLHKLQTLNLRCCMKLEQLPKGMKEMKSLVYLDIEGCYSLKHMPPGMGQLKGLRKLSKFIVGKKDGCKIGELKELNGLEGELSISGLDNIKSVADFKSANLMEKEMLTALDLIGSIDVEALSVLQPHQNLRVLFIEGYRSLELPDWMMDHNVCSLESLHISRCDKLQSLPSARLWCSSSLRILGIRFCPELITLSDDGLRHLTALQSLYLSQCPKMTSLPESIQHLTALQTLQIWSCKGLSCLPDGIRNLTTLVSLDINDCPDLGRRCEKDKGEDWPKIAHIPNIWINRKKIQGERRW